MRPPLQASAADVAEAAGSFTSAGLAALTLVEAHGAARLSAVEAYEAYRRADRLLKDTQDAEDTARLRACARLVMRRLAGMDVRDKNFTLYGAVHEFEGRLIEQALGEAGGSVVRAARIAAVARACHSAPGLGGRDAAASAASRLWDYGCADADNATSLSLY